MNKIQKLIYVTLRHEVVERISRELQVVISPEELLLGITENISLEKLAEIPLTYEQIRDMYASSNQINLSLRVLTTVEMPFDIVPQGIETEILDHVVRHSGNIWCVHKSDADPHPSSPHAHNYAKKSKIASWQWGPIQEKAPGWSNKQKGSAGHPRKNHIHSPTNVGS